MTRIIFTALAATTLVLSAAPAFAQDIQTQSVKVDYSDLNLASASGVKTFQHRLDSAVVKVCGEAETGDLQAYADMLNCRRVAQVRAKADLQLAMAAHGPNAFQLTAR